MYLSVLLDYYQLYQLGTGGHTQKAKPVQGVYPKPRIHTLCVLVITTNYSKTSSNELFGGPEGLADRTEGHKAYAIMLWLACTRIKK